VVAEKLAAVKNSSDLSEQSDGNWTFLRDPNASDPENPDSGALIAILPQPNGERG